MNARTKFQLLTESPHKKNSQQAPILYLSALASTVALYAIGLSAHEPWGPSSAGRITFSSFLLIFILSTQPRVYALISPQERIICTAVKVLSAIILIALFVSPLLHWNLPAPAFSGIIGVAPGLLGAWMIVQFRRLEEKSQQRSNTTHCEHDTTPPSVLAAHDHDSFAAPTT